MSVEIDTSGFGKPGYCKVCASTLKGEINKRLKRGESTTAIRSWAKEKHGFTLSKPTLLKHKQHITDPKTTFVEKARAKPEIRRVTGADYLNAVVDAAAARVAENPDDVTIDQGIRAAQVLESRKDKTGEALNVLILALSRNLEPALPGEWTEVPALPDKEMEAVGS